MKKWFAKILAIIAIIIILVVLAICTYGASVGPSIAAVWGSVATAVGFASASTLFATLAAIAIGSFVIAYMIDPDTVSDVINSTTEGLGKLLAVPANVMTDVIASTTGRVLSKPIFWVVGILAGIFILGGSSRKDNYLDAESL